MPTFRPYSELVPVTAYGPRWPGKIRFRPDSRPAVVTAKPSATAPLTIKAPRIPNTIRRKP